jgi:hypothetical protein
MARLVMTRASRITRALLCCAGAAIAAHAISALVTGQWNPGTWSGEISALTIFLLGPTLAVMFWLATGGWDD